MRTSFVRIQGLGDLGETKWDRDYRRQWRITSIPVEVKLEMSEEFISISIATRGGSSLPVCDSIFSLLRFLDNLNNSEITEREPALQPVPSPVE